MKSDESPVTEIERLAVAKVKCLRSLMFFTRYFFKQRHKRKFVINHHHQKIVDTLEAVQRGEITRLIINIAPRYGKTELAVKNFIAQSLSINPAAKFIHLSYSDDLALDNSEEIKDMIMSEEYQTLFPEVVVKKDSRAKKKWYTTSGGGVYAISASGQLTGFGAGKVDEEDEDEEKNIKEFMFGIENKADFGGAIIIDDPIKPDDAESSLIRDRVNSKYETTIKSRVNSRRTPIIIIMQRLHPDDLCGYLLKNYPGEWQVLQFKALDRDEHGSEVALWPFKHTVDELKAIRGQTNVSITTFDRQYQQDPKPLEGLLYSDFKTYRELPPGDHVKKSYCDSADTGEDWTCHIEYIYMQKIVYITNVIYSQAKAEITEPMIAKSLHENNVNEARFETNSGGRAFARNIERLTQALGNIRTRVVGFHQSKNKISRIHSNASTVMNVVFMPHNWAVIWPDFYRDITGYTATGKNKHDDAPDALTGVVENLRESAVCY